MKQTAVKILCGFLAVLMLTGIIMPVAEAAGSAAVWFGNGISVTWDTHWTLGNAKYNKWAGETLYVQRFGESSAGIYAYCIQPGYDVYAEEYYESSGSSDWWEGLGTEKKSAINLALYYGFPNNSALTGSEAEKWAATQAIIWEIICGYRGTSSTGFARTDDRFYLMCQGYTGFETAYGQITSAMQAHKTIPSFSAVRAADATIIDLTYNASTGKYSATVTDSNGVLSSFTYSMDGVTFTRSGNSLTITADAPINDATPVSCTKAMIHGEGEPAVIWTGRDDSSRQELVSGRGQPDPVPSYIRIRAIAATGDLEITKTFEGQTSGVSGVPFLVTGPNGYSQTHTTNANGKITITGLNPGTYTVTEQSGTANAGYVLAPAQTASVTAGSTATLTISNSRQRGTLEITKTFEGKTSGVSGVPFLVTGPHGYSQTHTTNASGRITIANLPIGTYTVTEQSAAANAGYVLAAAQTAAVTYGGTAELSIHNDYQRGTLEITKTAEGQTGGLSGVQFLVTGPHGYSKTHTTNASGKITIANLPIGTYTVTEQSCAANTAYVLAAAQNVTVEYNKTAKITIHNVLKKWRVTVTKTDADTGTAQGDASLAGAVYGVYRGGTLLDSYTTDTGGKFTTGYYPCGTNYTIREITASEGYLLNSTSYPVSAAPGGFTNEHNSLTMTVTEEVIQGSIGITKHTDSGITRIETPEIGARFQVYLKAYGSYDAAPEAYRDIMTANLDGYMESKALPYGTYTVHQTWSWPGRDLAADFDVVINEDGRVYRFIINNAAFYAYAKIVKTDAETGEVIPYAGAAFEIYDPEGDRVEFEVTYPEHEILSTFYTTADGSLITPDKLIYGEGYTLVEVTAPYGYVLDPTPISFDVKEENSTTEGTLTLIEVVRANTAQKGTIEITKTGEGFAAVTEDNGRYTPVYAAVGLTGAVYEIRAAEDIVTPDGTLRYAEGSLVDTITTDGDGKAESIPLYLGKYELTEITAPDGYVLDDTPIAAELVYADQTVTLTRTGVSAVNDRQTLTVTLYKDLEEDVLFDIGTGDEILYVYFGLYAAAEITAADGTVIPADGLIELAGVQEDGTLTFTADIPFGSYYVQEAAVGDAYLLSPDKYPVEFVYAGQDIATVEIEVNDGNAIQNRIIRGGIEGLKTDNETGDPLSGALIGLFRADATKFTEDTALMTDTSDEDGGFFFANVPYGLWIVREIEAPEGYAESERSYDAAIGTDGQTVEIEIVNTRIRGSIEISKLELATEKLLPDCGIRILDADGKVVAVGRTDETGVARFTNLPYGEYSYQEYDPPEGYVLDDTLYPFEISGHGEIVRVAIYDRRISSQVVITKTDSKTGTALYRAGIRFIDADGNTVAEGYTDENGVFSTLLTYGVFEYYEFEAPEGYVLDTTRHKVTITEDGEVIRETLRNDAKGEIVYTGDRSNVGLWITLSCVSAAAVGALVWYGLRRRSRPENGK